MEHNAGPTSHDCRPLHEASNAQHWLPPVFCLLPACGALTFYNTYLSPHLTCSHYFPTHIYADFTLKTRGGYAP